MRTANQTEGATQPLHLGHAVGEAGARCRRRVGEAHEETIGGRLGVLRHFRHQTLAHQGLDRGAERFGVGVAAKLKGFRNLADGQVGLAGGLGARQDGDDGKLAGTDDSGVVAVEAGGAIVAHVTGSVVGGLFVSPS